MPQLLPGPHSHHTPNCGRLFWCELNSNSNWPTSVWSARGQDNSLSQGSELMTRKTSSHTYWYVGYFHDYFRPHSAPPSQEFAFICFWNSVLDVIWTYFLRAELVTISPWLNFADNWVAVTVCLAVKRCKVVVRELPQLFKFWFLFPFVPRLSWFYCRNLAKSTAVSSTPLSQVLSSPIRSGRAPKMYAFFQTHSVFISSVFTWISCFQQILFIVQKVSPSGDQDGSDGIHSDALAS